MLVVDGVVKTLNVEGPGKFEVSDAAMMLSQAKRSRAEPTRPIHRPRALTAGPVPYIIAGFPGSRLSLVPASPRHGPKTDRSILPAAQGGEREKLGDTAMIQMQSRLDVADNTGAKSVMCIKVLGGSKRRYAGIGDVIKVSIRRHEPRGRVKKGEIYSRRRAHRQGVPPGRSLDQVRRQCRRAAERQARADRHCIFGR